MMNSVKVKLSNREGTRLDSNQPVCPYVPEKIKIKIRIT